MHHILRISFFVDGQLNILYTSVRYVLGSGSLHPDGTLWMLAGRCRNTLQSGCNFPDAVLWIASIATVCILAPQEHTVAVEGPSITTNQLTSTNQLNPAKTCIYCLPMHQPYC